MYLLGKMPMTNRRRAEREIQDRENYEIIQLFRERNREKEFMIDRLHQFKISISGSENLRVIVELIEKISSSRPISETEKRIVDLMSFLSFINSSVDQDIQQIINVIQRMKDCLTRFTRYSEQFGNAMLDPHWNRRDGPEFVVSENNVYVGRLKNELDELSRRLLEQKQSFEARRQSFSKEYSLQKIFSSSLGFSEYFSFMQGFKTVMEDITKRFYDNKSRFVQFLRTQIEIRTDFVIEIISKDLDFTGCDEFNVMNKFLETYPAEPFVDLRKQLEQELERINLFRL
jgi:hypothetical protein